MRGRMPSWVGAACLDAIGVTVNGPALDQDGTADLIHYSYAVFLRLPRWRALAQARELDSLWPVAWAPAVGVELSVHAIMATLLVGALCGAVLPHRWPARLAAFAGFFLYVALENSFGKINHAAHVWLLCAFMLVFLPDATRGAAAVSRVSRQRYLNAFWSAQALMLLTYSMAGGWPVFFPKKCSPRANRLATSGCNHQSFPPRFSNSRCGLRKAMQRL